MMIGMETIKAIVDFTRMDGACPVRSASIMKLDDFTLDTLREVLRKCSQIREDVKQVDADDEKLTVTMESGLIHIIPYSIIDLYVVASEGTLMLATVDAFVCSLYTY